MTETLTVSQFVVLKLVAEGYSNSQIAQKLLVPVDTIKTDVQEILKKLKVNNRIQAVQKAAIFMLNETPENIK